MQTGRTGVVRCDLVVRDSDVAQQVPSLEGAFGPSSSPDATPLAQLRASVDRPLLTMSDRQAALGDCRADRVEGAPTAPPPLDSPDATWRVEEACELGFDEPRPC